jgi:hypothetical protein
VATDSDENVIFNMNKTMSYNDIFRGYMNELKPVLPLVDQAYLNVSAVFPLV